MLRNILFLVAIAIIGWKLYGLVWPLIDPEGIVEEGSYRGLEIGDTKAETLTALRKWTNRVRFDGYYVGDRLYFVPSLNSESDGRPDLTTSDKWLLVHPGIHKETITLNFQNDRIASIKYQRNATAP